MKTKKKIIKACVNCKWFIIFNGWDMCFRFPDWAELRSRRDYHYCGEFKKRLKK